MLGARTIISLVVLGLCGGYLYLEAFLPLLLRINEKRQGPKALAVAPESDLEKAVALGCVLRFPDGSWMAIRYNDYHALAFWSLAIARDSGGMWFESTEHFCGHLGRMKEYQSAHDRMKTAPTEPPHSRTEWMRLLAHSPNLSTARERLTSRYFRQTE